MSSIDDLIRERLAKLKANDSGISTSVVASSSSGSSLPVTQKSSAAEQVEDLLKQISEESVLESKLKKTQDDIDSQIKSRLERLKSREGCDFSVSKTINSLGSGVKSNDELYDEEFFKKSSCTELLALSDQENSDKESEDSDSGDGLDTSCVICDQKPSLICFGCDKDVYCKKCFKEYHSPDEMHKAVPYSKK